MEPSEADAEAATQGRELARICACSMSTPFYVYGSSEADKVPVYANAEIAESANSGGLWTTTVPHTDVELWTARPNAQYYRTVVQV